MNATRNCVGSGGTQMCDGTCQWGACSGCMAPTTLCGGVCVDEATDSVSYTHLVALQFPIGGAGVCGTNACWVVFDEGSDWTLSGAQIALPSGACSSAAAQGAMIVVTTACQPKTAAVPDCGSWSSATTPSVQPATTSPLGQSCTGPASQVCGLCGTQTRTCVDGTWSAWASCTGEGVCQPSSTQSCGTGGTQTCSSACQWGCLLYTSRCV